MQTIKRRTCSFLAAGENKKKSNDLGSFDGKQMYRFKLTLQTRCQTIAPTACLLGNFRGNSALLLLHSAPRHSSFYLSAPPPRPSSLPATTRPFMTVRNGAERAKAFQGAEWWVTSCLQMVTSGTRTASDLKLTLGSEDVPTSLVALRPYKVVKEVRESSSTAPCFWDPPFKLFLWKRLQGNFKEMLQLPHLKLPWSCLMPIL